MVVKTRNSLRLTKPTAFSIFPLKKLASPSKLSTLPAPLVELWKKPRSLNTLPHSGRLQSGRG